MMSSVLFLALTTPSLPIMIPIRPLVIGFVLLPLVMLSACERTRPLSAEQHIERAQQFERQGDLNAAIIELKNALQREPDNALARWRLGDYYLKAGQGAEAEKELIRARELGISESSLKVSLASALLLKRDFNAVLDKITVQEQDSAINRARILRLHGDALLGLRRIEEACERYRQSVGIQPTAAAHIGLARCALVDGQTERARELIRKAQELEAGYADSWVLLGDLETGLGRHAQARAAYSKALQIAPARVEALYQRAKASIYLQDLATARQDVALLRKRFPGTLHWRYLEAYLALRDGKPREAQAQIQQVVRNNPDFLPGVVLAGAIALALDTHQEALTNLEKAFQRDPANPTVRRLLARTLSQLGRHAQALELITPLLAASPEDAGLLTLAGNLYLAMGRHDKAAEHFKRAIAHGGGNTSVRRAYAAAQIGLGQTDAGLAELHALLQSGQGDEDADKLLFSAYLRDHRYDELIQFLDEYERTRKPTAASLNSRGAAYMGKRDYATARRYLEQALAKDPSHWSSLMNLAQLDLLENKPDAARRRFEAVLKAAPNHAPAMLQIARLTPDPAARLQWLQRAAQAAPKALEPLQLLVEHHLALGETDRALVQARQMAALAPEDPRTLLTLGAAQLATRDLAGAESTYGRLTALAPDLAEGHLKLGATRYAAGKMAPAETALKRALQLRPDLIEAHSGLLMLYLRQRRYDEALGVARQVQQRWPQDGLGWALEGDVRSAQGRHALAAAAYRRAYVLQPSTTTVISLYRASRLTGDVKNSDTVLQDWLRQHADDLAVRHELALAHMEGGRTREAIAELERVVDQAPNHAAALNNLAWLYHQTGDARALATAELAYRHSPDDPLIADTLGWILAQRGDLKRALPLLRHAASVAPGNAEIRYRYAWTLMQSGDKPAARRELQQLLRQQRDFPQRREAEALLARP